MAKNLNISADDKLNEKSETFMKNMHSNMYFKSELASDSMSFDWVNEIEFACPYIDNIVKNPKTALVKEESVVKIEKAKKTSVASIKDLSRHTQYIEKINKVTNEVQPAKILITFNEDTFNTYENRFIFTLIDNILRFMSRKEKLLEGFESKNDKSLEYAATTIANGERINIELKVNSNEIPKENSGNDFEKEIDTVKLRIKKIKDYITSWKRSEFFTSLEKAHVSFVTPPIKKTNMILKNPNFQIAMRLWGFLQTYDTNDKEASKDNLDTTGDNIVKGILDDSFLMDFFVLDSISSSKRMQKEKLSKYAIIMFNQQIQRAVSLLLNSGIKISDEEILSMVAKKIENEKNQRLSGCADVKKKFKDVMDDYLERIQDYF
jgi:hypothetical protein